MCFPILRFDHVALMGLENTGFALANDNLVWIDPVDYQDNFDKRSFGPS